MGGLRDGRARASGPPAWGRSLLTAKHDSWLRDREFGPCRLCGRYRMNPEMTASRRSSRLIRMRLYRLHPGCLCRTAFGTDREFAVAPTVSARMIRAPRRNVV